MYPRSVVVDSRDAVRYFKEKLTDVNPSYLDAVCDEVLRDLYLALADSPHAPYVAVAECALGFQDRYETEFTPEGLARFIKTIEDIGHWMINQVQYLGGNDDDLQVLRLYHFRGLWCDNILLELLERPTH